MFKLGADLQVYLHREPIDFRAGINSLAVLVQEVMELDPFAPAVLGLTCPPR
ncbi:IS66 family insertion sequence element accessory protein TnpB [Sinorhizobium meliloti]|nr:IS66 family insertion sequence element accessory protein TnpB [Sinorhizobium meliloti]